MASTSSSSDGSQLFESSDSDRSSDELKHVQILELPGPVVLERGGRLPGVSVAYETFGRLNAAADNAVLICHALSGDSHVACHDADDDPGWWDICVGPGKSIDTDRYFVICANVLGGCRGTTGPNSPNPATGRPYGADFPMITLGDIVDVQRMLVDHLGIETLLAVVGGSLGGHMALTWATRYPDRLRGTAAIATSPRLTSQALAFDVVGRNAILRDPHYHEGQYYDKETGPTVGLAIARMLGHITYLSREAMMQKFDATRDAPRDLQTQFETRFSVGSYLAYQGDRFGERFDANSYLTLTMAMDVFDLGSHPGDVFDQLANSACRWLVISYTSDWLFPPFQSREIVDTLIAAGKPVSYCNVNSDCGHDAFLLPNNLAVYGGLVEAFLANLIDTPDDVEEPDAGDVPETAAPKSSLRQGDGEDAEGSIAKMTTIFHRYQRLDYDTILEFLPVGASVLDLGCGTGGLLKRLKERGFERIMGIELDERAVLRCVQRGLDVVQGDLNQGLESFVDGQFDFVVLSQTLQTVMDVERILDEMLRVGDRAIVSFPNIGYKTFRTDLAARGRAPRLHVGQNYHWYNTPNVRFLTIADFEQFCHEKGLHLHEYIALDTERRCRVDDDPNLNADVAIAVLSK